VCAKKENRISSGIVIEPGFGVAKKVCQKVLFETAFFDFF
jgi:hypothetical protein